MSSFLRSARRATLPATLLALAAAAPSASLAQTTAADSALFQRIRAEGSTRSRVMRTAAIISDVFGARLAGSPNYRGAADWAKSELASYGLANAHLEAWGTRSGASWSVQRQSVELTAPYYARLVAYPKAWSPSTKGVVRGTPMLVTDIRSDSDVVRYGERLRGRIVLLGGVTSDTARWGTPVHRFTQKELDSLAARTNPGSPKDYWDDAEGYADNVRRRQKLYTALATAGVAATIEPSRSPIAVGVAAYQAYDSDVSTSVPGFVMARGDYARVLNLVQLDSVAGQPAPELTVELASTAIAPKTHADSLGYDVIAELPGSDPTLASEVVMVGGHFDSWPAATGATDNAAGAAVAIEALRLLKAVGAQPKRTIRVALWDGEEHEDYFGSLGYVKRHFGDPETMKLLPEHAKISAYFNFDNGTGKIRGIWMQGNSAVRPLFARMLAPFADLGAGTLTLANTGSTDHMPFVSVGIPAFTFLQDPLHYETVTHHTNLDLASNLFPDDLKQAAIVTAAVLYQTANLAERLPRTPLPAAHKTTGR